MRSIVAASLLLAVSADYTGKDDVVVLTEANFKSKVLESDEPWLVEFYAPWCGHCKSLEPNWKKAAKQTKGKMNFGALDATQHGSIASKYGVQGYPTIKFFGENKKKAEDYNGGRSAADLKKFALSKYASMNPSGSDDAGAEPEEPADDHGYGAEVFMATDANFETDVKNSGKVAFVKFMAPWCGHCKSMVGALSDAAKQLKGDAIVAAVDATVHSAIAGEYNVKGFPTIITFFPDGSHEEYSGGRDADAIVAYVSDKMTEYGAAPEIPQITGPESFDEACKEHPKGLCVVVGLPHLIDGGAERRNTYLELLGKVSSKHRRFAFAWYSAGEQNRLDEALNIGVYPAMTAINFKKGVFGKFTQAFDESHIAGWLARVSAAAKLPEVIKIKPATKWDGEDYKAPVEDDEE